MKKYSTGIALIRENLPALIVSASLILKKTKDVFYTHGRRPRLIGRRNIEQKLKTCIVFKNKN